MKKTFALALMALATSQPGHAATGIFGSHIQIFTTTNTSYKGESFGGATSIQGTDLGDFTVSDNLDLAQSQIDTFKNSGGDVTGGEFSYRVYKTIDTPGSFTTVNLSFQSNATYTDLGGNSITGTGDQAWGNTTSVDLLALTSGNGNYTLEVFFKAFTNEGDRYSNNGGSNFKATFDVVPEPTAAVLGSLGVLFLLRRGRR